MDDASVFGTLIGLIIGFIMLIMIGVAIHKDCLDRGGSPLSATLWVVGVFVCAILVVPFYFLMRALQPPQPPQFPRG